MKKTFDLTHALADSHYIVVDDGLYMTPLYHDAYGNFVRCIDRVGEEHDVADADIIERGRFFKLVEFDPRKENEYEN